MLATLLSFGCGFDRMPRKRKVTKSAAHKRTLNRCTEINWEMTKTALPWTTEATAEATSANRIRVFSARKNSLRFILRNLRTRHLPTKVPT